MPDNVVVDFDGTLVRENSSRVMEDVLFSACRGRRRRLVHWIFFGSGHTLVTLATGILRRLTRRNIDWRFVLFLRVLGPTPSITLRTVIKDATARLTPNTELLASLPPTYEIVVISCGLAPLIERFCGGLAREVRLLAASGFSESAKGLWRAELLAPSDKIPYLVAHASRYYVTDDPHEAHLVAAAFDKSFGTSFSVQEVRGLYIVSASES